MLFGGIAQRRVWRRGGLAITSRPRSGPTRLMRETRKCGVPRTRTQGVGKDGVNVLGAFHDCGFDVEFDR